MTAAVDFTAVSRARVALAALARAHPELTTDAARDRAAHWLTDHEAHPMTADDSVQLGVRIPRALLAALDTEVERMNAAMPGVNFKRSDAVRSVLTRALTAPSAAPSAVSTDAPETDVRRALDAAVKSALPHVAPTATRDVEVRARYSPERVRKLLPVSSTAAKIGVTESMLRRWWKDDADELPTEALARLVVELDKAGL